MTNHTHSMMPALSPEDRQLVELAAKAAGIRLDPGTLTERGRDGHGWAYNPLDDDGQCFRLAVQFNASPAWTTIYNRKVAYAGSIGTTGEFYETDEQKLAATRRAIVRAAAEVGRTMP